MFSESPVIVFLYFYFASERDIVNANKQLSILLKWRLMTR